MRLGHLHLEPTARSPGISASLLARFDAAKRVRIVNSRHSGELVALNADVVGYSALVADDVDATSATMTEYRHLVETEIAENGGTLANFVGDSFMAIFNEAMAGLRTAIAITTAIEEHNATGEIMCLVEEPAVYKTVRKKVIKTPATTRTVEIPAEYKTVKVNKLVKAAEQDGASVVCGIKTVFHETRQTGNNLVAGIQCDVVIG